MPGNILQRLAFIERLLDRLEAKSSINYDKGSFSPVLKGSGVAGTFTYTSANLFEWTRIGNLCFFCGRVAISATAVNPTLNMSIDGWPFAGAINASQGVAGWGTGAWTAVVFPAGYSVMNLQFGNSTSAALVRSGTNVNLAQVQGAELVAAAKDFRYAGHYQVAAT